MSIRLPCLAISELYFPTKEVYRQENSVLFCEIFFLRNLQIASPALFASIPSAILPGSSPKAERN
ncbi:MAG: hypothetical protein J6Y19_02085 [Kiritimatiellae bacterium]|nr:hypothetical protein [Kiritimatiellia bacterium]